MIEGTFDHRPTSPQLAADRVKFAMKMSYRCLSLVVLTLLLGWPVRQVESYQPVEGVSLWTFPPNGAVPPNLRFLVSIGGMQDAFETSMLLGPKPLLELVSLDGEVVPIKFVSGPQGLVEGVLGEDLKPSTYYRLRLHPSIEPTNDDRKQLAREAEGVVWYVSLPRDVEPPTWKKPVELVGLSFNYRMPWQHPAREGSFRELEVEMDFSEAGGGPVHLFWTDSSLTSPDHIDFEHHQKISAGKNSLCCFPETDRLVRFEVRDAAGHTSSPRPNMLAFGD